MSEHRYPCTAEPPALTTGDVMFGHRHACIHDATADSFRLAEHQCSCGMSWVDRREQMRVYGNVPPDADLAWVVTKPSGDRWGIWPILIVLGACAAIAYVIIEVIL